MTDRQKPDQPRPSEDKRGSIKVDTRDPDELARSLFAGDVKRREPEDSRAARGNFESPPLALGFP